MCVGGVCVCVWMVSVCVCVCVCVRVCVCVGGVCGQNILLLRRKSKYMT